MTLCLTLSTRIKSPEFYSSNLKHEQRQHSTIVVKTFLNSKVVVISTCKLAVMLIVFLQLQKTGPQTYRKHFMLKRD